MVKNIKNDGFKPCPFCGSERIYASKAKKGIYRVECWCCGASVDSVASIDKAIKWWNTRADEVDCLTSKKPDRADSLGRIADDIQAVEERQGEDNEWRADAVFVSESTLREWSDRIRKLEEEEGEHED